MAHLKVHRSLETGEVVGDQDNSGVVRPHSPVSQRHVFRRHTSLKRSHVSLRCRVSPMSYPHNGREFLDNESILLNGETRSHKKLDIFHYYNKTYQKHSYCTLQ